MPERAVVTSIYALMATRLPDSAVDVAPYFKDDEAPENDTFRILTTTENCDATASIVCSIAQLEHLQTSIDALLQDRARELGPPAAIETTLTDEDGPEF